MTQRLSEADVEAVYESLAATLDRVPADAEALFLTRLSLLLAERAVDRAAVLAAIDEAARGLVEPGS